MSNFRITSGKYARRSLELPDPKTTRPTTQRVREAIFSVLESLASDCINGAQVLDGFAGSGALGLEALSRGAEFCTFIEQNPKSFDVLYENVAKIAPTTAKVFRTDLLRSKFKTKFGLVFLDPPYGKNYAIKAARHLEKINVLNEGAILVIEEDSKQDVALPDSFEVLAEKVYGDTKVIFCVYSSS